MATAQKTDKVRFVSKGRNLRLILLNPVDHPHPITGEKVEDQRGFTAEFARKPFEPEQEHASDGSFEWPPPESDPYAEFVRDDGIYVDPVSQAEVDVVAKLRAHDYNGVQFTEVGPSPDELLADQKQLLGEISRAIAQQDTDRLAEIYDEEAEGHKREPVLTASLEGLRAVEEILAAEREPSVG